LLQVVDTLSLTDGQPIFDAEENQPFQLSFNASLKVDFQGSRVTSDGGAKSGAEGGGSEQCLRNHLRGGKPGSSEDTNEPLERR